MGHTDDANAPTLDAHRFELRGFVAVVVVVVVVLVLFVALPDLAVSVIPRQRIAVAIAFAPLRRALAVLAMRGGGVGRVGRVSAAAAADVASDACAREQERYRARVTHLRAADARKVVLRARVSVRRDIGSVDQRAGRWPGSTWR